MPEHRAEILLHGHALIADGHRLVLLPQGVLWWPRGRALFVADLHLGKAATFRRAGLALPEGAQQADLRHLAGLCQRLGAARLVLLGDFVHARDGADGRLWAALQAWRAALPAACRVLLVRGNHDAHAGDPPPGLGIDSADEPLMLQADPDAADAAEAADAAGALDDEGAAALPIAACHHPRPLPGALVLAGHWHPVVHLRGPARDALRLPCFVHEPGLLVLPSFGGLTGGQAVGAAPGRVRYPVGAGRVWAPPTGG